MWRHPPRLGVVGVDFGEKPAIALVIPPKEVTDMEMDSESSDLPVACVADVLFQCAQDTRHKIICGFTSLDGSQHRYASAEVRWTGTADASDSPIPPGIMTSDHSEVDFTAFFASNRVVNYDETDPELNCVITCDSGLLAGEMTTVIDYADATPDVNATNDPTCTGTTYVNPIYNVLDDPVIAPLAHAAPNAAFPPPSCAAGGTYSQTDIPSPTAGVFERSGTNDITGGGFTRHCEYEELVNYTLTDEIEYAELAAALVADPLPTVTDVTTCDINGAFFTRTDDDEISGIPLGIHAQYWPVSFRWKRIAPATGLITIVYQITTYFPDLSTPIGSEEFTTTIPDGDTYSPEGQLEPDVFVNAQSPQAVYMLVTNVEATC